MPLGVPVGGVLLALLATGAFAIPQGTPTTQNVTTVAADASTTTAYPKVHGESSVKGWDPGTSSTTADKGCGVGCTIQLIHGESSVTGFEETTTSDGGDGDLLGNVLVTRMPSLIDVHTETVPTAQRGGDYAGETRGSTPTQDGGVPSVPQATAAGDGLLLDIISHIGIPPSPTNTGPGTSDDSVSAPSGPAKGNEKAFPQSNAATEIRTTGGSSGNPVTDAGPTPAVTMGGQITIGSAVLTLTPGLSSTLGDASSATYVAIATDEVGQTLITVSSSGTAITATITQAPATLTKPKVGLDFEASTTAPARSGDDGSIDAGAPTATTSSKGAAASQRANIGGWPCVGMGFAGLGLLLG